MSGELVLVTGGSGFVGAHCIVRLLEAGYPVRTTVRSTAREDDVRAMVAAGGARADGLSFATADLTADDGWAEAMAGAAYVLHVASPFPMVQPDDEQELIVPAREGTLRVLRSAQAAGVHRVVVTSSFAAIGYGHATLPAQLDEEVWSEVDGPGVSPYAKSKTIAERAAWDYVATTPSAPELAVLNPVGIFGPVLGPDLSTSMQLVKGLLAGEWPGIPQGYTNLVDVRDVADLELLAMTVPAAAGQRFLAVAGEPMSLDAIAEVLRDRTGPAGARVPTERVEFTVPGLGERRPASNAKARRVLGWDPRPNEQVLVETAESLLASGLLPAG
jgi:nucleoside-diphosphate-sugar epimerase